MRTSTAMSAAAFLATLILASGCSAGQAGTATPAESAFTLTSVTPTPLTSATPVTAQLPGGSNAPPTDQTVILGNNRLGHHQFNVAGNYDPKQVAAGIELVLGSRAPSGFELFGVSAAQCPSVQPLEAGTSFVCTVTVGGQIKSVTVDIISNQGWYIVQAPQ